MRPRLSTTLKFLARPVFRAQSLRHFCWRDLGLLTCVLTAGCASITTTASKPDAETRTALNRVVENLDSPDAHHPTPVPLGSHLRPANQRSLSENPRNLHSLNQNPAPIIQQSAHFAPPYEPLPFPNDGLAEPESSERRRLTCRRAAVRLIYPRCCGWPERTICKSLLHWNALPRRMPDSLARRPLGCRR